jgi:hypothetical protein
VPPQKPGDLLELAIGERPLELPDHYRVEGSIHTLRLLQQRRRLRPALPRDPPRAAHIEEFSRDRPVPGDQRRGHLPLPRPRRHRILELGRRGPPIEREPHTWYDHIRRFSYAPTRSSPGNSAL